jgi:hypothetical protein
VAEIFALRDLNNFDAFLEKHSWMPMKYTSFVVRIKLE